MQLLLTMNLPGSMSRVSFPLAVEPDLAEHIADDCHLVQQPVGVLIPLLHLAEELPGHERRDPLGPGGLDALRVLPERLALHNTVGWHDCGIGPRVELHRRRGHQRVFDVRGLLERIGLFFALFGHFGQLDEVLHVLQPVGHRVLVGVVVLANVGADLGQSVVIQRQGEIVRCQDLAQDFQWFHQ